MATVSSRDCDQDINAAKRLAVTEPVVITERSRPSHVLLSIEQYRSLVANRRSIVA